MQANSFVSPAAVEKRRSREQHAKIPMLRDKQSMRGGGVPEWLPPDFLHKMREEGQAAESVAEIKR